ncbi:MAG: hypothetical protein R3D25_12345 [Geminicoccaceae bacterium]
MKPARRTRAGASADFQDLPEPRLPVLEHPFGIVVTGIGGRV